MKPLISVIVPVYNTEKYLDRCLQSIINQSFEDFEIICVNDGSTDKCEEILENYATTDNRVVVLHQENNGQASARNKGLSCAKGKYICFVDSDDWVETNALEEYVSHMSDDVDIVVSGFQIDDEGAANPEILRNLQKLCDVETDGIIRIDDDLIINKITVMVGGKLFRARLLKENGITFLDGYKMEDNAFTTEYLIHSRNCFFIKKRLYHYVQRPNSTVYSKNYDSSDAFLFQFDYLYKRLEQYGLLKNHKGILTNRYSIWLTLACEWAFLKGYGHVKRLATSLAQGYDTDYFNNDLILHVKKREYGLIPQFDRDSLEAALNKANEHIESLNEHIESLNHENEGLKVQIKCLEGSVSFKIGRALTWLPRKLRGGVKCFKQNGLIYTVKRMIEHLGIDMGTGALRRNGKIQ